MNLTQATSSLQARLVTFCTAFCLAVLLAASSAGAATLDATFNADTDVSTTAGNYTATGSTVNFSLNFAPATGTALTVVNNTGLDFIHGTFDNLAQGQVVNLENGGTTYRFVANYFGGTGNDLVLQWAETRPVAWGNNTIGRLGNGGTTTSPVPVLVNTNGVLSGKIVTTLALGSGHSLALCSDGTLASWGSNTLGQLGNGTTSNSGALVLVNTSGALAGKTVIGIAAGTDHSLALCSDGTVTAWGSGREGQLGNGVLANSSVPVAIDQTGVLSGKTVVSVAAGQGFSAVLCSDGTVATWGRNDYGDLGNASTALSAVPVAVRTNGVLSGKTVVSISAGTYFVLALCSDGTVASWGSGTSGQLGGSSSGGTSSVPVDFHPTGALQGKTMKAVSAGLAHSLALCTDGTVIGCGWNSGGQLGNNATSTSSSFVTMDASGVLAGKTIASISASTESSYILCSDGMVAATGYNAYGELGNNTFVASPVPVAVSTSLLPAGSRFLQVVGHANAYHALGLIALPVGSVPPPGPVASIVVEQPAGTALVNNSSTVDFGSTAVAASSSKTFTIRNTGTTSLDVSRVTIDGLRAADFSLSSSGPFSVAAAASSTFTLTFTPRAASSRTAVLHIASNDPFVSPFNVSLTGMGTAPGTLTATFNTAADVPVTANAYTATGSTVNFTLNFAPVTGAVLTVINNTGLDFIHGTFGNLAQGELVNLIYGGTAYRFVANYFGGTGNDLVLQWADADLLAWGYNVSGQFGNGTTTNSSRPVAVTTSGVLFGKTIVAMSGGQSNSLVIASDGTIAAWGDNNAGQLGNNGSAASLEPVAVDRSGVLAGKRAIAAASGISHNLVLCSDGTLASWGFNLNGQLGNGGPSISRVPVLVDTSGVLLQKTVVAIAAGMYHSLALCSDGTVAAWGENGQGQLGDNSTTKRTLPVAVDTSGVLSGKTIVAIAAGQYHSLATCSDGTVVTWGFVRHLPQGTDVKSLVPVAVDQTGVLAGKTVISLGGGQNSSQVLCSDGTVAGWGDNSVGQLGDNSGADKTSPATLFVTGVLAGKKIASLAVGANSGFTLCTDGFVASWGNNQYGVLGNSLLVTSRVPVAVDATGLSAGSRFMTVAAGPSALHGLALAALDSSLPVSHIVVEQPVGTPIFNGVGTVNFGSVATGGTASKTFVVKNAGAGLLNISSTVFTGSNAPEFSVLTPPEPFIAAGSSSTFTVFFNPVAVGSRSALLQIASNDPALPTFKVSLTGSGITPPGDLKATFNTASEVPVKAQGYIATGKAATFSLNFAPPTGTSLTVVDNTSLDFIYGTFSNLVQGQAVNLAFNGVTYHFVANYYGGTGNDLVLQWADSRAVAWGSNYTGKLGTGAASTSPVPLLVDASGALSGKVVTTLAAGAYHNLALCSDGTLASWGFNNGGQLGNGTTTTSGVPVFVSTGGVLAGKTIVGIAAGTNHSLALCSDGTVAAWGYGTDGQLGNGVLANSAVPVAVNKTGALLAKTVISVAAGQELSVALCSDGTVVTWGRNDYGDLGNNSTTRSAVPVAVSTTGVLSGKTVVSIAAGTYFVLALCSDGTVASWGSGTNGQLGDGGSGTTRVPVAFRPTGTLQGKTMKAVSAGLAHSLALCTDGTVIGCGWNSGGQLGNNATAANSTFVMIDATGVLAGKTITSIAASSDCSFVVCSDGSVAAAGYNYNGVLGNNTLVASPMPVAVNTSMLPAGSRFLQVAGHENATHVLGLIALPPGSTPPSTLTATFNSAGDVPVTVSSYTAKDRIVNLKLNFEPAPGTHLMVVNNTGRDFIHGTFDNLVQGQAVDLAFGGVTYHFVATYYGGTGNDLVLLWADVTAVAWGHNGRGELANPVNGSYYSPTAVPVDSSGVLHGKRIVATATGDEFNIALCSDGTLAGWGYNAYGQLGNNSTTDSLQPVPIDQTGVLAGKTVVAVAAGALNALALCSDGSIAAWGYNGYGEFGNGSNVSSSVPVLVDQTGVLAGKTVTAIAAGAYHQLALCSDGTLAAWGQNGYGQLGNNSDTGSNVPVLVYQTGPLASKSVVAIAAGYDYSLALCSDGSVVSWGRNFAGALGTGTWGGSRTPVAVDNTGVLAGKTVAAIAAGRDHSLALCTDGTLAAWGYNNDGALGNNSIVSSFSPVAVQISSGVLAGRKVTAISAGDDFSLAQCADGTLAAWGWNYYGQLGNNSTLSSLVPVVVSTASLEHHSRFIAGTSGATALQCVGLVAEIPGPHLVVEQPADTGLVSGATVDFGSPIIGTHLSKTFTIRNTGTASMQFLTSVSGASAADFGLDLNGSSVDPGASIALTVTFTPGAVASRSALLHITTTGVGGSVFDINLAGVGAPPPAPWLAAFNTAADVPFVASEYTAAGKTLNFYLNFAPPTGTSLMVVNNTGRDFIHGTFGNLVQGQAVDLSFNGTVYHFVANYYGGTGNDLVLQWANTVPVAWGWNGAGALGNNRTEPSPVPVTVNTSSLLAGKTIASVATGDQFSLALCTDGTLASWGNNNVGQLGNNSSTDSHVPAAVSKAGVLAGKTVIAIAAGSNHSLALCSDGFMAAWGSNDSGALGNNTTFSSLVPVAVNADGVLNGRTVVAIAAGHNHSLALCSDGTLAAWGYNSGSLGQDNHLTPVAVNGGALSGRSVVAISAGAFHDLALCSDGTVVGWGLNSNGQLGIGSNQLSPLPVAVSATGVLSGKTVTAVVATMASSFVLCSDGTVAGFGWNPGTLGNDHRDAYLPVQLNALGALAGRQVTSLTAGQQHCVAVCSDGAAVSWGNNTYDQLGNNSSTEESTLPVLVNTANLTAGARFLSVSCGEISIHTLGIVAIPLTQPKAAAAGSFAGLVEAQSGTSPGSGTEGSFTATVQANRAFSSKLTINGQTSNIVGVFDDQGVARFGRDKTFALTIPRPPDSALIVEFKHDSLDGISGSVTQQAHTSTTGVSIINAGRLSYNGRTAATTVPAAYLGKAGADGIFNVILPVLLPYDLIGSQSLQNPALGAADYPLGHGFARARITRAGAAFFAGQLADGTPFTASAPLVGNAASSPVNIPLFTLLYNRGGFLSAALLLDSSLTDSDFSTGTSFVRWARPALNSQYYPHGWPGTVVTQLLGSKYEVKSGASIIANLAATSPDGNATLDIQTGSGLVPHAWSVNISKADVVTKLDPKDKSFTLGLNRATGQFAGTFDFGDSTRPTFQGLIYQKGGYSGGWGFSLSVSPKVKDYRGQSGMVQLQPR